MGNNIVSIVGANDYTAGQLQLIKNTVAKDTDAMEFDLFMATARMHRLDPFRKQISAIVFNKDKPKKRQMAIIVGIDGLRAIASRSKRYRPDEDEPRYEIDLAERGTLNPKGLVKASVTIWIADSQREGGWRPVNGVARWEEFAPIKDEWSEDETGTFRKTGKQTLDAGSNWGKMPFLMLAKCAEAQALRRAFPEDTSGLYEEAEFARVLAQEALPSQIIQDFQTNDRLERVGAANAIMFQFGPNEPLVHVPLGKVADRIIGAARDFGAEARFTWFEETNRHSMQEYWARAKPDALEVKRQLDGIRQRLRPPDATVVEGAS